MGTHSYIIMRVKQPNGSFKVWFRLYQQFDGYPKGVGFDLCSWLSGIKLVNGIPVKDGDTTRYANGPSCLSAQLVEHFKKPKKDGFSLKKVWPVVLTFYPDDTEHVLEE
jgi:hypothetical protein